MRKYLSLFAIMALLISCDKDNSNSCTPDYFIFGTTYGFCGGNCTHLFKIKDGRVFPDDMEYFYGNLKFKNTSLSSSKYLLAKPLSDNFPDYLQTHTDTVLGCPDCYDQGMVYIEIKQNLKVSWWKIDTEINSLPLEIRVYIEQMKTVVMDLE